MNPAYSVVFFTVCCGLAQGLFLAIFAVDMLTRLSFIEMQSPQFFVWGHSITLIFLAVGLLSSFLHLGHPERAWRAVMMWKTSWLSREVIVLPLFMLIVFAYGCSYWLGSTLSLWLGVLGLFLCLALFVCTAMIYMCLKFLQEWATTLTLINFVVLGCASGLGWAATLATAEDLTIATPLILWAMICTVLGLLVRVIMLLRNAQLKPRSSLQTAIGIKHPHIAQKAQGFMGGSFNTREFFHGRSLQTLLRIKWFFLLLTFILPVMFMVIAFCNSHATVTMLLACALQFIGLIAERWYFFAQANHPQNLYYSSIS